MIALLAAAVLFQAEPARAVISGPNGSPAPAKAETCTQVILYAGDSVADAYAWTLWPEIPAYVDSTGAAIVFTMTKNPISVVLSVASKGGTISTASHVITPGKPPPPLPPGPSPGPGPQPTPPGPTPDTFGLEGYVKTTVAALVRLEPAVKRSSGRQLAAVFSAVAKEIEAGKLTTMFWTIKTTNKRTAKAITDPKTYAAWEPAKRALEERLQTIYKAGKFKSVEDLRVAWLEIARGLEGIQ